MTIADFLILLVRVNLAAGAAIALVLALRIPVRRTFGAHFAYALWLLPLCAAFGAAVPQYMPGEPPSTVAAMTRGVITTFESQDHDGFALAIWCVGAALGATLAVLSLARFMRAERAGSAGPAVVGVVVPRLVVPSDAPVRYTAQEWRLIRAHERAHMDRQDGRGAAVAALAQWLCWFNPLLHLVGPALRLDQELACDATVLERLPVERRRYAETLLRTHDTEPALFVAAFGGCGSLEVRLAMLSKRPPSLNRLELGEVLIIVLGIAAVIGGAAMHAIV
ncbi:MAG TPA: M56 family metallopeptidase [Caulobacteraceae bacterium]|jgi:beta-lactamase regulating signal transducer with metallopeptidase domain|nr:M56 family metallopeptidase [Caulobacteraceae bacterium]